MERRVDKMKNPLIIDKTRQDKTRQDKTAIHALIRPLKNIARRIRNNIRYHNIWKENINLFSRKNGIEIGGPSAIFTPIYAKCSSCDGVNFSADTTWWQKGNTDNYYFSGKKLGSIFIADAVDMSCIHDNVYDFVISSNNLEHIANPIKALKEFMRISKNGGIIVVIVPMKNYTFDHKREYTKFEHMLSDYENDIDERDLTHLPEILELHDLSMDPPAGDIENFRQRSLKNYENRCLHHHVFCEDSLRKIYDYLGLEVIYFNQNVLGNYVIIGRK